MKAIDILKAQEMDAIPTYIFKRDVLGVDRNDDTMIKLKEEVLASEHVNKITQLQLPDGSWGKFHTLSIMNNEKITTEQALRRLLYLGLDKNDDPIKKAINYIEGHLSDEYDFRDYNEKKHDWKLFTHMIGATWIKLFDNENEFALKIARNRAQVVEHAFSGESYNNDKYKEAYNDILSPQKGKYILKIENFYQVSLLKDMLTAKTEKSFMNYIMNYENGILYIYEGSLSRTPDEFCSRVGNRYINAYNLVSNYRISNNYSDMFVNWINSHEEDGLWDMSSIVKDHIDLPLSTSWRKSINRKIDCSIKILKVLRKLNYEVNRNE
ncbi:MAG: hypothetical protein KAQ68_06625 [Clostridiales bacterium]|nr:hypothetical protein [Clostridiales bacterium]